MLLVQTFDLNYGYQPVLRIQDVYPGSRILIFTHPESRIQKQQQKRGVKKIVFMGTVGNRTFFVATNFTKLNTLFLNSWSGKNLFRILDPGFKKAPDPWSATPSANIDNSLKVIFLAPMQVQNKLSEFNILYVAQNFALLFPSFRHSTRIVKPSMPIRIRQDVVEACHPDPQHRCFYLRYR